MPVKHPILSRRSLWRAPAFVPLMHLEPRLMLSTAPSVIDLTYGDDLSFGHLGNPQEFVNIIGRVTDPDGVDTLTYRLNGSPERTLSIGGPGANPRLANNQFNADIDIDNDPFFVVGTNNLELTATDSTGDTTTRQTSFLYEADRVWPLPYAIDWDEVDALPAVTQVVDGEWVIDDNGVSNVRSRYDRLVAVGDMAWTDYEVETTITVHSVGGGAAGIGFIMRWTGHTDEPPHVPGDQPLLGFESGLGSASWFRYLTDAEGPRLVIADGSEDIFAEDLSGFDLAMDTPYVFRSRVETLPGGEYQYTLSVWEEGQPEASGITIQGIPPVGTTGATKANGSVLLVAHRLDATFGDVVVRPIHPTPVATDDNAATYADTAVVIDVLNNDTDADGNLDPTSVQLVDPPLFGGATVDPVTGAVTYTPPTGFLGVDSFTYNVRDATSGLSNTATVTVTVGSGVTPPVVSDDTALTMAPGAVLIDVLANDSGLPAPLDPSTVTVHRGPVSGSTEIDPLTGVVTYTPDAGFAGVDAFYYTVENADGVTSDVARVDVQVDPPPPNLPPIAADDQATTDQDTAVAIDVLDNDADPDGTLDPASVEIVPGFPPLLGAVDINPSTGAISYTPDPGQVGVDTFRYRVADDGGEFSNEATVTVNVNAVISRPVITTALGDLGFYAGPTDFTMSTTTAGGEIRFTLDGTDPTPTSPLYVDTQPVNVSNSTTLKARTYIDAANFSDVTTVPVLIPDANATLSSDSFDVPGVDLNTWVFYDPRRDDDILASVLTSTGSAVEIAVPGGDTFDLWRQRRLAPRLLQDAPDTDMRLTAQWDSTPDQAFQFQGFTIHQDEDTLLRFDIYHDGTDVHLFGAELDAGGSSDLFDINIGPTVPAYQRLTRVGDLWTFEYSVDGQAWQLADTATAAITVNHVGVHAGSHLSPTSATPAFTGTINAFDATTDWTGPRVTEVVVSSSAWSTAFVDAIDAGRSLGYAVPLGGATQFDPLPWSGLDRLSLVFDEEVAVSLTDLEIVGAVSSNLTLGGVVYDPATHTATWSIDGGIPSPDALTLTLADAVTDAGGNALDGEWQDGLSNESGDGEAGGAFVFTLNVLPGDVSQDAQVNTADFDALRLALNAGIGQVGYSFMADTDGSGLVRGVDALPLRAFFGQDLTGNGGASSAPIGVEPAETETPPANSDRQRRERWLPARRQAFRADAQPTETLDQDRRERDRWAPPPRWEDPR